MKGVRNQPDRKNALAIPAICRRCAVMAWFQTVQILPEVERRDLEDVLAEFWEERSGILNWLVEGVLTYLREGLRAPPEVLDATAAYRADMDHVQGLIDGCVTRTGEDTDKVQALPLYRAYIACCEAPSRRSSASSPTAASCMPTRS